MEQASEKRGIDIEMELGDQGEKEQKSEGVMEQVGEGAQERAGRREPKHDMARE